MKKRLVVLLILIVCTIVSAVFVCCLVTGSDKRRPPAIIKPIQLGGVEFRAPNNVDSEGIVEARDLRLGKLLWQKKIYYSAKMPLAEDQENFMKSMTNGLSGDELTIVNERGGVYALNIKTKKIRTVTSGHWCWAE